MSIGVTPCGDYPCCVEHIRLGPRPPTPEEVEQQVQEVADRIIAALKEKEMSWSVTVIGKPDKVAEELDKHSDTLTGQSKTEYDEAKPALQSLVRLNVGGENLVKLTASGHANFTDGKKTYGTCGVTMETFYAKLAL